MTVLRVQYPDSRTIITHIGFAPIVAVTRNTRDDVGEVVGTIREYLPVVVGPPTLSLAHGARCWRMPNATPA